MKAHLFFFIFLFPFFSNAQDTIQKPNRLTFWTESKTFFAPDQNSETNKMSGYLNQNYSAGVKIAKYFRVDLFSAVYADWHEVILYPTFLMKVGNLNFEITQGFGLERDSRSIRFSSSCFFYSEHFEGLGVYEFNSGYAGYFYTGYFVYKENLGDSRIGVGLNFQYNTFVGPRIQYTFPSGITAWFSTGPNIEKKTGGFGSGIFIPFLQ